MQLKCFCWLVRTNVRHSRDCPFCKCNSVYSYKFQFKQKGEIAVERSPGNTITDKFICDVCIAPDREKCEIICIKRIDGGRCWPTIHEGNDNNDCNI